MCRAPAHYLTFLSMASYSYSSQVCEEQKMLSMSIQPSVIVNLTNSVSKDASTLRSGISSFQLLANRNLKTQSFKTTRRLPRAAELAPAETSDVDLPSEFSQPPQVVEKEPNSMVKPRLVLKFIWMEKNIGLALDHMIPGHGTVPLSPYFFWPRKDAWEELKTTLESKPWISQKRMIILLNQATDIINLWQQSGGNLS